MGVSVVVTVKNEEGSVGVLLESFFVQTKNPNEIIIVDGGSSDKTVEIIKNFQKKFKNLKLIVQESTRSRGRNIGVEAANFETIVMTDADCVAKETWLKKITAPFKNTNVDIVAGFYKMKGKTPMQKAMATFLGVLPQQFNERFLPSTRSIAFRKSFWKKIGGFPERKSNSAEDTEFNYQAVKAKARFARVKTAVVEWSVPETLGDFFEKIRSYARWDIKSGIWWHPQKKLSSHNIKALFIILRYLAGLGLLIAGFDSPLFLYILFIGFILYVLRAYKKAKFWGIVLQFTADFAVMIGFISGTFS